MSEQIYHLTESGQLEPMSEESFDLEDRLQELVAENPSLLSGEQMNPENPRRFILIGREQGIADIIGGSNRWALDHLLIDQDAIPTLVEAKRSSNSQIRREIVGQMMDYAAHATQTWNIAEIRQAFEGRVANPDAELAKILGDEADVEEFWQKVEINLRAKRLRLLFVADGIPDELTRVVEFLNEQMPGIEVLAVEIKQFKGVSGATLVPRVIGRTSEAKAVATWHAGPRGRLRLSDFPDLMPSPDIRDAVSKLFEVAKTHNARIFQGSSGVSLRARMKVGPRSELTVAWIYPPGRGWSLTKEFTFGAGTADPNFFASQPEVLRTVLEEWATQFQDTAEYGATEINLDGLKAWVVPYEAAAANIDLLCERLERVLKELSELQPAVE